MTILYGKKADNFMEWFRWQVEKGTLPDGTTIDEAVAIYGKEILENEKAKNE